jgi:osmotically-inducible protein OsmY
MKTDSQLKKDVNDELEWEPAVHAQRIGVEVNDGVVTLSGEVSSFSEKWSAERVAQRVPGVKALAVSLKVNLGDSSRRTDADIARSANDTLSWTNYLPIDAVKVMVEDGWLTLTGDVEWQYQREYAESSVRHLMGVTGVSNQIAIKQVLSSKVVKSDIEAALKRRAVEEAKTIDVAVKGSVVTLSGTIKNWPERDLATQSAWSTPGVYVVIDNMTLAS